ncbi:hypothetical protein HID58_094947 [Brassica napus]|uniref:Uncharacterized protein n=1 Tax=Brassica napus TaxID=3708 RepID=A0ABQ7X7S4_BRANA|nr:hypothetical protein HID58_094947 [Brassica napus]
MRHNKRLWKRYLGVNREEILSEVIRNTNWNWRSRGRRVFSSQYDMIHHRTPWLVLIYRNGDMVMIISIMCSLLPSSAKTWEYLRTRKDHLPWHKIVWFSEGIPQQSFTGCVFLVKGKIVGIIYFLPGPTLSLSGEMLPEDCL